MSDFSLFSLFTAGLALCAPLTAAYTQPKGDAPKGNPISQPGLASVVPVGEGFTVTWEPTTPGTVTLVLLKGPSENAVPQYAIAEKIENDGSYVWTPKENLEPTDGATGYGLQLIVDKTGQYQYTTQFGISNPDYKQEPEHSSSSAAPTVTPAAPTSSKAAGYPHGHGGYGHSSHNVHSGYTHSAGSGSMTGTASSMTSSYTHMANGTTTASQGLSTGYMPHNATMTTGAGLSSKAPVGSTMPTHYASSSGSTTASPPAQSGNAGSSVVVGFGGLAMAAGAAVFAL